jgi:hypothetical protein
LIRVVRLAFAIGAGSWVALESSVGCEVITGSMVDNDSGSRRVRNSVEDCLYILEIWEEACREDEELREAIEELRS